MKRLLNHLTANVFLVILFITSCAIIPPVIRTIVNIKAGTLQGTSEEVAKVENLTISGPTVKIPLRIYTPEGSGPLPILMYMHGGGWVFGNLDSSDNVCRFFANKVGCIVISVDYRLAPKHKFPAAVEDAYFATQWAFENAGHINGDSHRIAVGGASAGGNLAAAVCLMAKDQDGPPIVFQLLAYPATNLATLETDSYRYFAKGYGLTKARVKWFRKQYLEREEEGRNTYASPLLANNLSNLPPALVITGEFDVLRDEGEAYANRLKQEGVSARNIRYAGMGHMAHWSVASDKVGDALNEAVSALRSVFSK